MNRLIRIFVFLIVLLLLSTGRVGAQIDINIDFNKITKDSVANGVVSANLCWLLDSDKDRQNGSLSFNDAIDQMGVKSLRFPYGHLADNYLWDTPPYNSGELKDRVASPDQTPASWSWAVDKDGYMPNAMDFDEYMELCNRLDIKPLVVVNALSFVYKNGPTLEELVVSAKEWVRYAKDRGYHVEYWQIGNEVDHHPKQISMEQYIDAYQQIASAMKSVDSSIKIGPGILSRVNFFNEIINRYPNLIDFTSCHQYLWGYSKSCSSYELWKEFDDKFIPNVIKMNRAVANSVKPNMEILITESGISPSRKGMGNINNLYKSLWWFEMAMNEAAMPNVSYIYNWGTHSPWNGEKDNEEDDLSVLLRIDNNSRKPTGEVTKLINDNLYCNLVEVSGGNKYIRVYASKSDNGEITIFILNRDDTSKDVEITVEGVDKAELNHKVFTGDNPKSREVSILDKERININDGIIKLSVAPTSITILRD